MKRLSISDDVIKLGVFVAMAEVSNIDAGFSQQALDDMIKNVEEKYRSQDPEYLKNDSVVRAYRDFYWRIGIDPTKTRPSGEALRRRLARGNRFPRINIVVDIGKI